MKKLDWNSLPHKKIITYDRNNFVYVIYVPHFEYFNSHNPLITLLFVNIKITEVQILTKCLNKIII